VKWGSGKKYFSALRLESFLLEGNGESVTRKEKNDRGEQGGNLGQRDENKTNLTLSLPKLKTTLSGGKVLA